MTPDAREVDEWQVLILGMVVDALTSGNIAVLLDAHFIQAEPNSMLDGQNYALIEVRARHRMAFLRTGPEGPAQYRVTVQRERA